MINIKAILAGLITTIIVGIANQLFFVLAAAAIGNADDSFNFFSSYKHELWFASGLLVYCITMAIGGATTAFVAKANNMLSAAIVGALASGISLATSAGEDTLTLMSIVLVILGIGFAVIGSLACSKLPAIKAA